MPEEKVAAPDSAAEANKVVTAKTSGKNSGRRQAGSDQAQQTG